MSNPSGFPRRIDHGMVAAYNWQYGPSDGRDVTGNRTDAGFSGATASEGVVAFDGFNDYINVSSTPMIPSTDDWTVAFWAYQDVSENAALFAQYLTNVNNGRTLFDISTGNLRLFLGNTAILGTVSLETPWTATAWNHVVGTRLGNTFTIYLNGEEGATISEGLTRQILQTGNTFGARQQSLNPSYLGNLGSWWDGSIGETRIYNRALSATEISELYRSTVRDYIPAASTTGLEAWYRWNGNANDVLGVNDGTLVGDASATAGVLTLDGTGDYVSATAPFTTANDFTIAGWFNTDSVASTQILLHIEQASVSGGDGLRIFIPSSTALLNFDSYSFIGGIRKAVLISTTVVAASTWYHYAITYNAGSSVMYLDGVSEDTSADPKDSDTYDFMRIGSWYQSALDWDGQIGETRLYNRALSATEITTLYNDTRGDYA